MAARDVAKLQQPPQHSHRQLFEQWGEDGEVRVLCFGSRPIFVLLVICEFSCYGVESGLLRCLLKVSVCNL